MNSMLRNYQRVLLSGNDRLTAGIAVCLLRAGHEVFLHTQENALLQKNINQHIADLLHFENESISEENLVFIDEFKDLDCQLAIIHNAEDLTLKKESIAFFESQLPSDVPVLINSESIPLPEIIAASKNPQVIIGANWSEPAHTSFFLELFCTSGTDTQLITQIESLAKASWQKDPYVLRNGRSIRSKMMTAMLREAFYLVENDYVRVEDIDRACRNDAGYYLPFAGNFRYMDLMGGYLYGVVMQDLNPELSTEKTIPAFCKNVLDNNGQFYEYASGEEEEWENKFRKFSYEIRNIITKYHADFIPQLHPAL